jgi:hypothetical protein
MENQNRPVPLPTVPTPARVLRGTLEAFTNVEWTLLAVGSISCGLISNWIAAILGIPGQPGFAGSLLCGPSPVSAVVSVVVAFAVTIVIGTLIAGMVEFEAGLFCCCLGLAGLGIHCGPIRPVLQYAAGSSVYLSLALECAILGAMLFFGWMLLLKPLQLVLPGRTKQMRLPSKNEVRDPEVSDLAMALGSQVLATAILEMIFLQSDQKPQAICGLFLASFLGSLVAYMVSSVTEGRWFWIGPCIVGVIGYLLSFLSPGGLAIGESMGWSAALVRATPLDYAGAGTAGAILGFWCSRRWHQPEAEETVDAPATVS